MYGIDLVSLTSRFSGGPSAQREDRPLEALVGQHLAYGAMMKGREGASLQRKDLAQNIP